MARSIAPSRDGGAAPWLSSSSASPTSPRAHALLDAIADAVRSTDGVTLLDVDLGRATNRTVFTKEPAPVIEAAVRAARVGAQLIDMSQHSGEHPRFGGMDVCLLVPVSGIMMEETVQYARARASSGRGGRATIFCYENAATRPERRNLAVVREASKALPERLASDEWKPDFGPAEFQPRTGATAVGARDFLVAYNVNLNTTSTRRANAIAFDVREKGRIKREPDPLTGEVVRDANGEPVWTPGLLKACKGIGWFIEEYGVAQISMNLTDLAVTPVHAAFDACVERAGARGIRVTGSEIVGLVPLAVLLDAGRHYLVRQGRSVGALTRAHQDRGLDHGARRLAPFDPASASSSTRSGTHQQAPRGHDPRGLHARDGIRVPRAGRRLHRRSGGGRRRGPRHDGRQPLQSQAGLGRSLGGVLEGGRGREGLSRPPAAADRRGHGGLQPDHGRLARRRVRSRRAHRGRHPHAIEVPLEVMEVSLDAMGVCEEMARIGMEASLSDAAVGGLCLRTATLGAGLNVRINAKDLKDSEAKAGYLDRAAQLENEAIRREEALTASVRERLG